MDDFVIGRLQRFEGRHKAWYRALVAHEKGTAVVPVHNRWGSWMVECQDGMMAEPERVFGSEQGKRLKKVMMERCYAHENKINDATGKTKPPRG